VVRFDRIIPPGGAGGITLKLNTNDLKATIQKSAVVYTNDPQHPQINLTMSAHVEVPISIEPPGVMMHGFAGEDIQQQVTITANEDQPLTLEPEKLTLQNEASYHIVTLKKGKLYRIVFTNTSQKSGKYGGVLTLKTNYAKMPQIKIMVLGFIENKM
jgi:hypothetical protein